MLVLSRGPEEAIVIGEGVEVKVLEVHGDRVRLGIVAPPEVPVHRKEIYLALKRENVSASSPEAAGVEKALDLIGGKHHGPRGGPGALRKREPETGDGLQGGSPWQVRPNGARDQKEKDRKERKAWL